ncbi:hypothetical protein DFP73DRAFT_592748 [Morchella snyderi]|nr:hypothetical protein DFP73DRAFT_592748 [Morchella snyderi]
MKIQTYGFRHASFGNPKGRTPAPPESTKTGAGGRGAFMPSGVASMARLSVIFALFEQSPPGWAEVLHSVFLNIHLGLILTLAPSVTNYINAIILTSDRTADKKIKANSKLD